jgi:ketosteroid isomerase-like protein
MSSRENVEAVRRLFEAFYRADEDAMSALIGGDFVTHAGTGTGNAGGGKAVGAPSALDPLESLSLAR